MKIKLSGLQSTLPKIIGVLFLLPPLIGVVLFVFFLIDPGIDEFYPFVYEFWYGYFKKSGGGFADSSNGIASINSNLPIYLGLMAIAGAYLIKPRNG
jgi:hypothetical protein